MKWFFYFGIYPLFTPTRNKSFAEDTHLPIKDSALSMLFSTTIRFHPLSGETPK